MHQFKIDGKPHQIKTEWPELSAKQVLAIVPLLFSDRSDDEARKQVQQVLFPLSPAMIRRFDPEDLFRLRELCAWVWDKPLDAAAFHCFEFAGTTYLLPEKDLEDVVLFEYAMADHYLRQFTRKDPDLLSLDKLIATICRPAKRDLDMDDPEWDGDQREKYNSKIADRRALEFAQLPMPIKIIVLQCFVAGQRMIHTRYQEIFAVPEGGGGKSSGPDLGWFGQLDYLAEQGVFGDYDKTAFTRIHTVCFHLRKKHYDLKSLHK